MAYLEKEMLNIPITPDLVDKTWLTSALSVNHENSDIFVKDLKSLTNEGGVLSSIFKAVVDINGKEEKIFIKTMPMRQDTRVFIENFPLDEVEVRTYTEIMPMLQKFEEEYVGTSKMKDMLCKFWAAKCSLAKESRGFYVILEDISESFAMPDLDVGLSNEQVSESLKSLACFHAISYCYGKINGVNYLEKHKMTYLAFLDEPDARKFIDNFFKRAIDKLKERNEIFEADVLLKLSQNYVQKFKEGYDGQNGEFLTHGDMWSNNVMFHGSKCKIVDWQFTCASSPYLDIAAMAFLNQDPDKARANSKSFLQEYFDAWIEICSKTNVQMPWASFDEFEKVLLSKGYTSLFVWLIVSFSPCVYSSRIMDRFVFIIRQGLRYNSKFFD